ncbi:TPA: NAD-dependent ubiquitin ligase [Legionella pneumophila]|jgi:hypothetical protein|uniref:NAD-dependent ubiquitin ligase n=1 Tax=Legionella pneumophila TaxID=446 RepID=A0AAN5KRD6_LEGPN|nr:NAD-dependent ubiquitin ligase [Legionella pneumophila]HAT1597945.1 NAD-dependent ubiquitin ligase [Legionella pneumophila]HAT1972755.1 NAD-dependent ubiquitin ligase [Legionella pneumophila]HAT1973646.1 NAD-dependent ubiquitin ligase [Legionella pneumophila]HAT6956989.1 NAD-dependent ubiquitin ligase [Legionella pneumophila]
MVTKIVWVSNNGKPNLKMEFISEEEKNKFFNEVKSKASELGLNFPLVQGPGKSLLIEASNYPMNPCGCYVSPGGKLAINFGKVELSHFILPKVGVKTEHAEIFKDHNTIFFHKNKLPNVNSELTLGQVGAPVIVPVAKPTTTSPTFFNPSKSGDTSISITATGSVDSPMIRITFQNKTEREFFLNKITDKAKSLGVNISTHPFEIQEPNMILIKPSKYPDNKLGCYISKNKEVAINLGRTEFRDFVLSNLGVGSPLGTCPTKNETGNDTFYFHQKSLSLNGPPLSINTKLTKEVEKEDYLLSTNGVKAIDYVWNNFLKKTYNPEFKQPDANVKAAWEKHTDWEHWSNMGQDWSLNTPSGLVPRPNHGIAHTLRVAQLVPVIAEFLKAYSGDPKFQKLTQKEIQKAQYMMLFSVIGRENDMSWTDANHYQQAFKEAYNGKPSKHIYATFKENAKKGFLNHVDTNKSSLIPSLFSDESELQYWAEALDTGKPGISSASGILMALAHDLDLMRCYDEDKFNNLKMKDLVARLGGNKEAAKKLADYAHDLIIATGDRCMGYGVTQDYNYSLFGKCSLDPNECLKQLQSIPKPETTLANQYGI